MRRFFITMLPKWANNVGIMVGEFPIGIHASQKTLQIYGVGGSSLFYQNFNHSRVCVNYNLSNHKT
jgi:hypothetical protein